MIFKSLPTKKKITLLSLSFLIGLIFLNLESKAEDLHYKIHPSLKIQIINNPHNQNPNSRSIFKTVENFEFFTVTDFVPNIFGTNFPAKNHSLEVTVKETDFEYRYFYFWEGEKPTGTIMRKKPASPQKPWLAMRIAYKLVQKISIITPPRNTNGYQPPDYEEKKTTKILKSIQIEFPMEKSGASHSKYKFNVDSDSKNHLWDQKKMGSVNPSYKHLFNGQAILVRIPEKGMAYFIEGTQFSFFRFHVFKINNKANQDYKYELLGTTERQTTKEYLDFNIIKAYFELSGSLERFCKAINNSKDL